MSVAFGRSGTAAIRYPCRVSQRVGARNVHRDTRVDPFVWRCQRALARIEPQVEAIVAEHATSFWQRGAARSEAWPGPGQPDGRVVWTIDNQLVLELRVRERGAAELVVHDFSLIDPLRTTLRTRHVRIRHATSRDAVS